MDKFAISYVLLRENVVLFGKLTHRSEIDFQCVIRGLCYWQQLKLNRSQMN